MIAAMPSRQPTVARIGRSYPRPQLETEAARPHGEARRYSVFAGLIMVMSALGLIGWLLVR